LERTVDKSPSIIIIDTPEIGKNTLIKQQSTIQKIEDYQSLNSAKREMLLEGGSQKDS